MNNAVVQSLGSFAAGVVMAAMPAGTASASDSLDFRLGVATQYLGKGIGKSNDRASVAVAERIANGGTDYTAWNADVKRNLTDELTLDLRWYDTDGHGFGDAYDGRLVGALTYSF